MKKRLLVALLVLAMVPAALFAGFFDFGIGATAQFVPSFNPYETEEFDWAQLANIDNYGFGADIRTRIMFAELDIAGLYSQETVDSTTYHVQVESWRSPTQPETISIRSSDYGRIQPGRTTVLAVTKPGRLGFEWLVAYEIRNPLIRK
ncbi:MAG: hypothetical protein BWY82_02801 [Verrucomicrobia bacterium ADurb.Bin474]|nr:MAG: hypothetical protein BWY82_02801 [Verrucomicrobia bacterium ADurb.Bin474]